MKNVSINALCILIIIFLLGSIVLPAVMLLGSFSAGMMQGDDVPDVRSINLTPVEVNFTPNIEELENPSVFLTYDQGDKMPTILHQGIVMVPSQRVSDNFIVEIAIYAIMLIALILLLIDFIKFIININKGKIFERNNLRYLSRFGIYLIAIGLLECIAGIFREIGFGNIGLTMQGYTLSSEWAIPWTDFLLGFLALLLARVWSIGMSMREEQQLTI